MKKTLIIFALLCSILGGFLNTTSVMADTKGDCDNTFLGLPAWYDGLTENCEIKPPNKDDNGDDLKKYIWTIVLNISALVLGVVGYLAVGFVVWGGFLYLTSTGDPGRAAKGRKTIVNALIGTVICVLASSIMKFIKGIVNSAASASTPAEFFNDAFGNALVWGGILCVVIIVIAGIEYTTSIGNPQKVSKAKNTIMYAAIGLIVIICAAAIINFVLGAL